MIDSIDLKKFNEIYDETYHQVVKYVVCKCSNMDDVNDIIQEVYIEVYRKVLCDTDFNNTLSYVIGIAKNKIKKHYHLLSKLKTVSLFSKDLRERMILEQISNEVNIEKYVLDQCDIELIWKYLKKKKMVIQRIFYLYYNLDFTIKQIASELDLSESYIKNSLYRTLNELQRLLGKEKH